MVKPRWIHWSAKPKSFGPEFPRACRLQPGSKPEVGRPLWVSDENDYGWREWCRQEEFRVDLLKHAYEITFKPGLKVLQITNPNELLQFTRTFVSRDPQFARNSSRVIRNMFLDWIEITAAFDAVLITPYQWSMRLDARVSWYYGWDCASGVVMDPRCIENITNVTKELVK